MRSLEAQAAHTAASVLSTTEKRDLIAYLELSIEDSEEPRYGWWDFEQGDSTPAGYFYITIINPEGDEFATIVHRASAQYPIDGDVANEKRKNAQYIVDALNTAEFGG